MRLQGPRLLSWNNYPSNELCCGYHGYRREERKKVAEVLQGVRELLEMIGFRNRLIFVGKGI
jgi:hypothetical protein